MRAPIAVNFSGCPKTTNPRKGTETRAHRQDGHRYDQGPKTTNPRKGTETRASLEGDLVCDGSQDH